MPTTLDLDTLKSAIAGTASAFRCITEYQPAGGAGDKVFPPTYEGGKYAVERRYDPTRQIVVDCVLIDSVQSQANRMEEALRDSWEAKRIVLPVLVVDFVDKKLEKTLRVTSLDAPHRLADAILRDSSDGKHLFRHSDRGKRLDTCDLRNATAVLEMCPTALVFGMWDSTGPKGGLGAKFPRALVSEIVGFDAVPGVKTSSRIDPLGIQKDETTTLYRTDNPLGYKLIDVDAKPVKSDKVFGKEGKPSEANHGNVTPGITNGGFTISKAVQTTTLSLPALRRLWFPAESGAPAAPEVNNAARTALAALGLCAATLGREAGCDLRSRCQLVATTPFVWELLDQPGEKPTGFSLPSATAIELLRAAVAELRKYSKGAWPGEPVNLKPSDELLELVIRSQRLAVGDKKDSED